MVFAQNFHEFIQKYGADTTLSERRPRSPLPVGSALPPSTVQNTSPEYSEYRNKDAGSKFRQETMESCTLERAIKHARENGFRIVVKLDNGIWYFKSKKTSSRCTSDEKLHEQLKNSSNKDYTGGDRTAYFIHL